MVSTKHVVLGLLLERKGYAYELQQRLDTRFAFLGLSKNVVYPLLDALAQRDGWARIVGYMPPASPRSAPRPIYAPTSEGEDEFVRWIGEPCELGQAREDIYVKLVLSRPLDWQRVLAMADGLEAACLVALRELQDSGQPSLEELMDLDPSDEVVTAVLVDDAELLRLRAAMAWLDRVRVYGLKRLERLDGDG